MKRQTSRNNQDPRSGIVLVTVLWTIALISVLAMAASTSFRGFANIIALDRDRARADALLKAGVELSGAILIRLGDKLALSEREEFVSLPAGDVHIRVSDEMGRIDLNKAPAPVLASLLHWAGAGDRANLIAKSIDTLRTQDQASQSAANGQAQNTVQAAVTAAAQTGTAAKTGDTPRTFTDLRQLAQIPGMEPEYLAAIEPLVTVFGSDKINALTAPADVIAALPGINPAQASSFLNARARSPNAQDWLQQLLGPAKDSVTMQGKPVALVEAAAHLSDGYTAIVKAVIVVVPNDKQPYRILSWTPVTPSERRLALRN